MIFLLVSTAFAHQSEPQSVLLVDEATLWTGSTYDSGWVPADSPLMIRFQIESVGGGFVEMEGQGDLEWPESVSLYFTGLEEGGLLVLNSSLDAVTSVKFDVAGYTWESELDRRGFTVRGEDTFTPFLLDGGAPEYALVEFDGPVQESIEFEQDVFTAVSVKFAAELSTAADLQFAGVTWMVADDQITTEGATLELIPSADGMQVVDTEYIGTWDAGLDLIITPTFEVCVDIIGCWEIVRFDIPIPIAADSFEQTFPESTYRFPLPVLEVSTLTHDFGTLEIGELANLELGVANLGELDLEGYVGMLGSPFFSAYPDYFLAGPGQEDGMMVSFAPTAEGTFSGTLVLESNDPAKPVYEVHVTGTAIGEDSLDGDTGESGDGSNGESAAVISSEVQGCGCANSGGSRGGPWAALIIGLGLVVQRRRRTG